MKYLFFIFLLNAFLSLSYYGTCQHVKVRPIDINIVPGFGTTGLDHDLARNYVSVNIFSGYSDQTLLFQISTISGSNRTYSGGLHIAGIGNFTGVNLKSIDPDKYETSLIPFTHLQGFQVAGIINLVRGDVTGGQASAFFNVTQKELIGTQIGGLFNYIGRYAIGVQIGGIGNYVSGSISGIQLCAGINRTGGELYGTQIALINSARTIEGKNSTINDNRTGFQIGVLNLSGKMNGFQIGLFNFSKKMQGTQIGLINVGQGVYKAGEKQGTFIGLINIGDIRNLSVFSSELFLLNTVMYTGVLKNGRLREDTKNKYLINGLSWSKYPTNSSFPDSWAVGYGIARLLFNRSSMPTMNERHFYGFQLHYYHINTSKSFEWELNEILQLGFISGIRLYPKSGIYGFVSINLNTQIISVSPEEQMLEMIPIGIHIEHAGNKYTIGPGLNAGLLLH